MMVGAKDFKLKQWTITDPQGYGPPRFAVSNLDNSKRPDPSLFKIDYYAATSVSAYPATSSLLIRRALDLLANDRQLRSASDH